MTNNVIDFEAKKLELFNKRRAEEVESLYSQEDTDENGRLFYHSQEDFIRGELFVVEGLLEQLEFLKARKSFKLETLIRSLYAAKKDLSEALKVNNYPEPIS